MSLLCFHKDILTYLKGRVTERQGETYRGRYLSYPGSFSQNGRSRCSWVNLKPDARSLFQVPDVGGGPKDLGYLLLPSQAHKQEAGSKA